MSQNGFLYDSKRASAMSAELKGLEEAAERKAWLVAGRQVKGIGTGGKDLAKLFFQELKAPVFMRSALTHAPSLGVDVLRAYAAGGREDLRELSKAILECRRARKLRSTYIDNVSPGSSGRVHPSWLSYGAVSGRFACIAQGTPVEIVRDVAQYPAGVPIEQVRPGDMAYCFIDGELAVRKVLRAQQMGIKQLVRVHWGKGRGQGHSKGYVDLTPDHRVQLISGEWCPAGQLRAGSRVFALGRHEARGYQILKATNMPETREHRFLRPGFETVHHANGLKSDNRLENLLGMTNAEHRALHAAEDTLTLEREVIEDALEANKFSVVLAAHALGHDFQAFKAAVECAGLDLKQLKTANRAASKRGQYERAGKKRGPYNNHRIERVEPLMIWLKTYDLEIEEAHNFIAGEISVHNCQGPNLMNLPRAENDPTKEFFEGGIRSLYLAPAGSLIFGFDCSQLEMRICAYASGDPVMIASCESSDMHSANAAALFGEAFTSLPKGPERSMFRTLAKTSGFAAAYLAEAETVHARLLASGVQVKMRMVEAMLRRLKRNCAGYYAWQDQRLLDAVRLGWTDEPVLGRRRWVGHDPSPTETANFPIQGGAAGHMNTRLPVLEQVLRSECQALCVAQVHDAAYFEIKESHLELAQRLTVDIFQEPQSFGARKASLPVDMGASERWH